MLKRREFIQGVGLVVAGAASPLAALAGQVPVIVKPSGLSPPSANLDSTAPPPKGFASNHNYFMYGGGKPIWDLVVTIEALTDIVAPTGMGMQLNAYSPAGYDCVYQQYTTGFDPRKSSQLMIAWGMESWPSKPYHDQLHATLGQPKGNIFNVHGKPIGPFPTPSDRIPAGYKIRYELLYDANDPKGTVTGASYTVTDERGREQGSGNHLIRAYKIWDTKTLVGPSGLAPILAFQLNLVGVGNGRYNFIQSGVGTITYEAAAPMTAEGKQPTTIAAKGVFTKESSNIVYTELSTLPSQKIVQKFGAGHPRGGPPGQTPGN
jgi:hypothetical protein